MILNYRLGAVKSGRQQATQSEATIAHLHRPPPGPCHPICAVSALQLCTSYSILPGILCMLAERASLCTGLRLLSKQMDVFRVPPSTSCLIQIWRRLCLHYTKARLIVTMRLLERKFRQVPKRTRAVKHKILKKEAQVRRGVDFERRILSARWLSERRDIHLVTPCKHNDTSTTTQHRKPEGGALRRRFRPGARNSFVSSICRRTQ